MSFYCFNPDCNLWGEAQGSYKGRGRYLLWPGNDTDKCNECGGTTVVHDNWDRDYRTHDDGTPVADDCVCEISLTTPHRRGECWYSSQGVS